jgi:hypothetical protein
MEHPDSAARTEHWLRVLVVAVAAFVMLLFVVTALERMRYPYELEQLEGYNFLCALRVFHGQPLYPRPSLAFVPYMYPPVYFYVSAGLGRVMGMSITTLRAVSTLSTLGCFAMIYAMVWREVHRHLPAIAAAGFYAGCYTLCDGWFDLGRLDSFFILTVLLAMYATRWWYPVWAALLWMLAFQTKQSILPAAFVLLCFDIGRSRRQIQRTLMGVVTLAVGAAGSVLWLNHATKGWYSFYVFKVPSANADLLLRRLVMFWPIDMLRPFALPLLLIVAAAVLTRPSLHSRATRFYLAAGSLLPLYWWVRLHNGSSSNALMPVDMLLAMLFGLALARLLERAEHAQWNGLKATHPPRVATSLILLAALLPLTARIYNPHDDRPTAVDRQAMDAIVAAVREAPGEVYVAQHPYYSWLAGKPVQADIVSIQDAMRPVSPARDELQAQMRSALANHRFSAILFDQEGSALALDRIVSGPEWRAEFTVQRYLLPAELEMRPDWILLHAPASTPASSAFATPSELQGR